MFCLLVSPARLGKRGKTRQRCVFGAVISLQNLPASYFHTRIPHAQDQARESQKHHTRSPHTATKQNKATAIIISEIDSASLANGGVHASYKRELEPESTISGQQAAEVAIGPARAADAHRARNRANAQTQARVRVRQRAKVALHAVLSSAPQGTHTHTHINGAHDSAGAAAGGS